ncbi:serine hydrolase domain-containing protein [Nocardia seriolae]|uniref:Hydrolase n=1 Tax=Nocardia seriolae TaxID=37332 RepID=A0ABC8B4P0_9NOCA|nr:serine hydrolase domain-containing protein [Nocardia seriolae]APB00948.1 Serine-type D-Ala-D-Ala carboxypeptidase [Nocardia seriolae]OJF82218.1 hydrolase [Nocardia seriolae]PSK27456.1 hydrolase [Nocardia seriolae]QOW33681.1 beta-lactamase family protein [Nocardia seriolae]QUN14800.1 beta-lactamase family protein [Nocardia seriolae]
MTDTLDTTELQNALEAVHAAGIPGLFAEVRDHDQIWCGAAGVADIATGRPVTPDMRHRVGSLTKSFTAAAVLRQVDTGTIELDTPIGHYLPRPVPGERGSAITVRMLINHTSGLAEYFPRAFPSLAAFPVIAKTTPQSLDDNRFTRFQPTELIELGVSAPATGTPGGTPGVYSNTNYLLLSQLLERVTGTSAEQYITHDIIERAGLRDTEFPAGPHLDGPHSLHYESWFGMIDPPRDYSVYDMSWVGPAASLISTTADLNRYFGLLVAGEIISPAALAQMQRTVPVVSFEGKIIDYGLGLEKLELPGHGTYWGQQGSVWGGGAIAMTSADGNRQLSLAVNLQRWNRLDPTGKPQPHPIDSALQSFILLALAPTRAAHPTDA